MNMTTSQPFLKEQSQLSKEMDARPPPNEQILPNKVVVVQQPYPPEEPILIDIFQPEEQVGSGLVQPEEQIEVKIHPETPEELPNESNV